MEDFVNLKAGYAKIVGTPKEGVDSWVLVEDGLFLVLELGGPASFPITLRGKEIIDQLIDNYRNLLVKNLTSLKELVDKVKIEEGLSLSLVLGVQVGRVFYLVSRGAGRVIAKRESKFAIILSQDGSASGILQDQDVFLLTTLRFSEIVSHDEVKNAFDNLTISELAESLTSLVHRAEDTSGVAALILEFKKINQEWEEEREKIEKEERGEEIGNWKLVIGELTSKIRHLLSNIRKPTAFYLRQSQGEEERKKRTIFGVAIILAGLLVISIILGFNKRADTQKQSRFSQTYKISLHQYEEGKALIGLNNLRAATLLNEAKASLEEIEKDFGKNSKEAGQISELLSKIEQELATANQIYKITPEVFLDLGLVKEEAEGSGLKLSKENLIVLDSKNSSLYQINIKSKSAKILAGGEKMAGLRQLAVGDGSLYVLTDKGILEAKFSIKRDPDWGEIVDMESFGSNLYLLDKGKSAIWKYIGRETGFSEKRNYLQGEYSLTNVSSMAIDGSVWLGFPGKISKFVQGREENFVIQGIEQPLGTNPLLFTSEETKDLYVLDRMNNRVVVLEKTGTYKSQYQWEENLDVADFVVSEEEKKIFLLSGNKIYKIDLKL